MSKKRRRRWLLIGVAAGLLGGGGLAEEKSAAPAQDDKMSRLEAALDAAQQRIASLEQQVSAAAQQDTDKQRADVMKQQIREILSEREFRESLMPSVVQAGYDKGFYIRSSDDKFLMKVGGMFQFRWTYYNDQQRNRYTQPGFNRPDLTGFDIQRGRLKVGGNVYNKDLTYFFEFEWGASRQYAATVQEAWVNYRFVDALQAKTGIFKVAGTRGFMTSTSNLQMVDLPVEDAVFNLGYGLGVRLWGQLFDKRVEYMVDVVNSLNGQFNRTIVPDPPELDGNPAIAARAVWHALGDDPLNDFVTQSDNEYHKSPALDLGVHYAFNEDRYDAQTTRIFFARPLLIGQVGGFGVTSSNGLQTNTFGVDSAFKYLGFSTTAEYNVRIVDPRSAGHTPYTPLWLLTGDGATRAQQGGYVQCGYFLPIPGFEQKIEVVGRVGGVVTNDNGAEGSWEYGGGLNYFIDGNRIKLQTDVTKVYEIPITTGAGNGYSLANVNDDALIFRVQLQVAF